MYAQRVETQKAYLDINMPFELLFCVEIDDDRIATTLYLRLIYVDKVNLTEEGKSANLLATPFSSVTALTRDTNKAPTI